MDFTQHPYTYLKNPITILIFRLIVGIVLIYASYDKIVHPGEFAKIVANYHFLPFSLTNLMALILPWLELFIGSCLILGIFIDGASLLSLLLMGMFIIALSQAIIRGIDIQCGCFTVSESGSRVGVRRIIEDVFYLIISYLILTRNEKKFELYPKPV